MSLAVMCIAALVSWAMYHVGHARRDRATEQFQYAGAKTFLYMNLWIQESSETPSDPNSDSETDWHVKWDEYLATGGPWDGATVLEYDQFTQAAIRGFTVELRDSDCTTVWVAISPEGTRFLSIALITTGFGAVPEERLVAYAPPGKETLHVAYLDEDRDPFRICRETFETYDWDSPHDLSPAIWTHTLTIRPGVGWCRPKPRNSGNSGNS